MRLPVIRANTQVRPYGEIMAGIDIKIDAKEVSHLVKGMAERMGNAKPAMEIIGETVFSSIQRNFEEGGRPDSWAYLRPKTITAREKKMKWPGQILVIKGVGGGLLGSISYDAEPNRVTISANKEYAAIHHFGGQAGRNHAATIPARPYMLVQDEDWPEITMALNEFIMGEGA